MPDPLGSGRDLLREWQKMMESLVSSTASMAGRAEFPRQLAEPMQRQLELMRELVERQQRLQREVATRLTAPVDAVFDLLEDSASMMRAQSEALESAGSALEESARLMKRQAELFERTVVTLRRPSELAKAATGVDRPPRRPRKD
jgi:methyl-accepting chemotaxis protein